MSNPDASESARTTDWMSKSGAIPWEEGAARTETEINPTSNVDKRVNCCINKNRKKPLTGKQILDFMKKQKDQKFEEKSDQRDEKKVRRKSQYDEDLSLKLSPRKLSLPAPTFLGSAMGSSGLIGVNRGNLNSYERSQMESD